MSPEEYYKAQEDLNAINMLMYMIIVKSKFSTDITEESFIPLIKSINVRIHKLLEDKKYLAYCLLKEDIAYKNIQEAFGPVLVDL